MARAPAADPLDTLAAWEEVVHTLAGVADVADAQAEITKLRERRDVRDELRRREKSDARERKGFTQTRAVLAALWPPAERPVLPRLLAALDVESLREDAVVDPPTYESRAARRRLEDIALMARLAGRALQEAGEAVRAEVATEVTAAARR